jgi:hypothetical protein
MMAPRNVQLSPLVLSLSKDVKAGAGETNA